MSTKLFLILILVSETFVNPETNSYNYGSYSAVSTDTNLSEQTLSSSTSDQSVVYITQSGITITDSNIQKQSGDSSNTENSEFYGVNAAVLVNGGGLTMTGGTITTAAKGANSLCATNNGKVTISGTTIISTGESSARGLHATYGGEITATNVKISSSGGSCATLATDRGEGTVTCTGCELSTAGQGSPLIYSTGNIQVSGTTGTATGAQAVVVEGKNTASVLASSNLKCYGIPNKEDIDKCGVMLYQSMSGDAASGTSTFNCQSSTISIESASTVYESAPMFFITNTNAVVNLEECNLSYGSNIFLKAAGTTGTNWGSSGSNGGVVTLNLKNQNVVGNFVVDDCSGLTINLESSTIEGTINSAKTGAKVEIILDEASTLTLTGDSYYTTLTNSKSDGSNIIYNDHKLEKYDESDIKTSSSSGTPSGSGTPPSKPSGSGTPSGSGIPSGSGTPPTKPSGSGTPPEPPSGSGPTKPSGSGTPPEPPSGSNSNPSKSSSSGSSSNSPSASNGSDGDDEDEDDESGARINHVIFITLCIIMGLIL